MLSKNNRKLQERKLQEKQRFGFRKYSFGLASALLGVSFMLGTGSTVSAATTKSPETVAATMKSNPGTGAGDNATDNKITPATSQSGASATENPTGSAAQATDNKITPATSQSGASATENPTGSAAQATDNAASAKGEITDEGKAKGLTDSDVKPKMSDAKGASLVADNSNIPSGYKADPTEGRYTVGIVSLGGDFDKWVKGDSSKFKSYNGENNTHYYLRFSTSKNATNGTYDSTVYSQVVDATTDTVKWEQALTPNSGAVKVNNGTDGF